MSLHDIAELVTAIAALLAAAIGTRNGVKIKRVHKTVNSEADRQRARIDQLTTALTDAGADVPTSMAASLLEERGVEIMRLGRRVEQLVALLGVKRTVDPAPADPAPADPADPPTPAGQEPLNYG